MTRVLLLLCLLAPALLFAEEAIPVNYDDLPHLVQHRNSRVQGMHDLVASAQHRTGYLERSFLPTIDAGGGAESFQTSVQSRRTEPIANVRGTLNLFRGGRDLLEERGREVRTRLARHQSKKWYVRELQRARDLYTEILFLQTTLQDHDAAIMANRQHLTMVQQRIDAGLTTDTDFLDFRIQKTRLRHARAMVEEELEHGVDLLQAILGYSTAHTIVIRGTLEHRDTDAIFHVTFDPKAHHDIAILQSKTTVAHTKKRQANRWWTPELNLYTDYTLYPFRERERNALSERDEFVAGIQLRMHLFDGLQSHKEAKAMRYKASAYQRMADQTHRELGAHFRELQHTLKLRHALVHESAENVRLGTRYLTQTEEEYRLGTKNAPDVLAAAERVLHLKSSDAEIRRDFFITKNGLLSLTGQ